MTYYALRADIVLLAATLCVCECAVASEMLQSNLFFTCFMFQHLHVLFCLKVTVSMYQPCMQCIRMSA